MGVLVAYTDMSGSSKQQGKTLLVPENKQFTYSEILSITNNFERVIGKGGFGTVYHGYLHIQVSVKMLSPASVQGYKQFQEEVSNNILIDSSVKCKQFFYNSICSYNIAGTITYYSSPWKLNFCTRIL